MRLPSWFSERAEPIPSGRELRVSTLELFFDLVFVFTLTQLTALLVAGFGEDAPAGHAATSPVVGGLRALLVFGVMWWMYSGYAWLTNTVPPERPARRVLVLMGMGGFLVMALAIPTAFEGGGWAFALGYLIVVLVHAGLYLQATASFVRVVPFNLGATALLFAAGFQSGTAAHLLWAAALVLVWTSPYFIGQKGFTLHAGHIVERHGLLVIVALGESVVAIGIGAHGLVSPGLLVAASLGLVLAACLWWSYFAEGDEEAAEHALTGAEPVRRTRMILGAYFYAHMPMLLGVVAVAAGVKKALGHPIDPLYAGPAIALSAGVVLYLAGDAMYRRVLLLPARPVRLAAAGLAAAATPLGLWSALAQLAALAALLVAVMVTEHTTSRTPGTVEPQKAH
ncbi:low temperature requirement protein A [Sphaerisporangium sp. TRM90804]|uniref:low temperature requirement protein A n=1 Tax=Sphaerisporangium sp. TRM90804 TaxID=3031113 RepID=UPI0024474A26|nr:low temperature requirement protein A [Sphaerisporangium sp. TRM90804]MDH2428233.1 low temperature requirement protein A [Sphaerisporangium sp. TRM90804]